MDKTKGGKRALKTANNQQPKQKQPKQEKEVPESQPNPKNKANNKRKALQEHNETVEDTKLPQKKQRPAEQIESAVERPGKLDKAIFGIFNELQNAAKRQPEKCLNEMMKLLKEDGNGEACTATCAYALKRLVRCTGADNKESAAQSVSYIYSIISEVTNLDVIELLKIMKNELHVGNQQRGKEESLAAVGHLLTALAVMKSERFREPPAELIAALYPIIICHLKGREYLVTLSADVLAQSFSWVSVKDFESHVWPLLKPELMKPISGQKLHNCDLLLAVHLNYPKLLPLKQLELSLWQKKPQYEQLFELYLNSSTIQSAGVYKRLGKFLATAAGDQQLNAWREHIVKQLPLKIVTAKCYIISTLSYVLVNYVERTRNTESPLEQLFSSDALVSMLLTECSAAKHFSVDAKTKATMFLLRDSCRQFETSLLLSFEHRLKQDSTKLTILKQLLKLQPQLDNHVKTPRLTQQLLATLNDQSQLSMYQFYLEQFTNSDEEQVSKAQREHCLNKMQQLLLNPQLPEREKQIEYLLLLAFFHLDKDSKHCTAAQAAVFSRQAATRCEEIAFSFIINKIGSSTEQLTAFYEQLQRVTQPLISQLTIPGNEASLRVNPVPNIATSWESSKQPALAKLDETKKSLLVLFNALALVLRLALYSPTCNIKEDLLEDVLVCKDKALGSKQKTKKADKKDEPEPSWKEVLIDVLLQLLLQNGSFWRTFVNAIGGALIPHLDRSNLEQLLAILDMSKNPLGNEGDESVNGGEPEDSDNDNDDDDEDTEDESEDEETSDDDNEEEDEEDNETGDIDDNDNDEDVEPEDDEDTQLAKIRENVRQALVNDDENNDASSVDWNDVDEAQGERLNLALESAFKAFKPKGNSSKSRSKQQTKTERISTTALLHFRIRVLDLVELFVSQKPEMETVLDALSSVFYVYQTSINDNKLKPLAEASKKLLRKLVYQKIAFASPEENKAPIIDSINEFMALHKQPTQTGNAKSLYKQGDLGEWRDKCIAYLVSQFNETSNTSHGIWPVLQSFITDWATRRSSQLSLSSFDAIFKSHWCGIAALSVLFGAAFSGNLRHVRRVQILKLLLKHARQIRIERNEDKHVKKLLLHLSAFVPTNPAELALHKQLTAQLQQSSSD